MLTFIFYLIFINIDLFPNTPFFVVNFLFNKFKSNIKTLGLFNTCINFTNHSVGYILLTKFNINFI